MTIQQFEEKLHEIRSKNGWIIELEFNGIWIFKVIDKNTGDFIASTGSTGLEPLIEMLQKPFDECPWV